MNSLHIDIAQELIACAKNKTTICYSDLCNKVGYPSQRTIGRELEKVSLLTYDKCGIFLSVLVVEKETQGSDNPIPGAGFFTMYVDVCGKPDRPMEDVVREQRENAFEQDWSTLIEDIQSKIK